MSQQRSPREGIKYGDVFNVSGELASETIAPRDASAMQSAEATMLGQGQTQRGGPAAVMQSAANYNEKIGAVEHKEASDVTRDQGVTIVQTVAGDRRTISEAVGGQVIGEYVIRDSGGVGRAGLPAGGAVGAGEITIGEALEATALAAGNKTVNARDAAAIQAAELRATGSGQVTPGGMGAAAISAANLNPWAKRDQDKTKLGDILMAATDRLPDDKPVTREDAERVMAEEIRSDPSAGPRPGGVAAALSTAARLNELNPPEDKAQFIV